MGAGTSLSASRWPWKWKCPARRWRARSLGARRNGGLRPSGDGPYSAGRNVTFPARQYSVNGERRSFALLWPIVDATAQDRIRDLLLETYAAHEEQAADLRAS